VQSRLKLRRPRARSVAAGNSRPASPGPAGSRFPGVTSQPGRGLGAADTGKLCSREAGAARDPADSARRSPLVAPWALGPHVAALALAAPFSPRLTGPRTGSRRPAGAQRAERRRGRGLEQGALGLAAEAGGRGRRRRKQRAPPGAGPAASLSVRAAHRVPCIACLLFGLFL
jgi:hypothetical protein